MVSDLICRIWNMVEEKNSQKKYKKKTNAAYCIKRRRRFKKMTKKRFQIVWVADIVCPAAVGIFADKNADCGGQRRRYKHNGSNRMV